MLRIRKGYVIEHIGFTFRAGDENSPAFKKYQNYLETTFPHLFEEIGETKKVEKKIEDITFEDIPNRSMQETEVIKRGKKGRG